jgi:mRNA degradation ribonuclease J1/J2
MAKKTTKKTTAASAAGRVQLPAAPENPPQPPHFRLENADSAHDPPAAPLSASGSSVPSPGHSASSASLDPRTILRFYGAKEEIGGNKISLLSGVDSTAEKRRTGMLLDFGVSFSVREKFYPAFHGPRRDAELLDLLTLGLLPLPTEELAGLYNPLYFHSDRLRTHLEQRFQISLTAEPMIKYVFISHLHLDHIGYIKYLHPSIELVCLDFTYEWLQKLAATRGSGNIYKDVLSTARVIDPEGTTQAGTRGVHRLSPGEVTILDHFEVKVFPTDHSMVGSAAVWIRDTITHVQLLYLGDLRFHGILPSPFTVPIWADSPGFRVVLSEATNVGISPARQLSERDVEAQLRTRFATPGFYLYEISPNDLYRYIVLCAVAGQAGYRVILPDTVLPLLQLYMESPQWGQYFEQYFSDTTNRPLSAAAVKTLIQTTAGGLCPEWVPPTTNSRPFFAPITIPEIRDHPEKIVFPGAEKMLGHLIDIFPGPSPIPLYWLIMRSTHEDREYSVADREEMLAEQTQAQWLTHFFPSFSIAQNRIVIHASGHAYPDALKAVLKQLTPDRIYLIHSENPAAFRDDLAAAPDPFPPDRVVVPATGDTRPEILPPSPSTAGENHE